MLINAVTKGSRQMYYVRRVIIVSCQIVSITKVNEGIDYNMKIRRITIVFPVLPFQCIRVIKMHACINGGPEKKDKSSKKVSDPSWQCARLQGKSGKIFAGINWGYR
jgi:hypothetical protein